MAKKRKVKGKFVIPKRKTKKKARLIDRGRFS